jgi:anti-sigma B factor antagonist
MIRAGGGRESPDRLMGMEFEITDRKLNGDTQVVAVHGEIDLFTAPEFKQRVSAPIDAGRSSVIVDLTDTTFIDSSSLGVLIGAHRRLKLRGGTLVVVCDNDAIVKTFRITGLDGVFTLVRSLDDALDGDAVGAGG